MVNCTAWQPSSQTTHSQLLACSIINPPACCPLPPAQLEEPGIRSSRLRQLDAEQLAAAVEDEPPGGPGGAEFTIGGKKKKKGGSEGGGDFTIGGAGGGGGGSKKGRGQVRRGAAGRAAAPA